jgi:hypothetical protein
MKSVFQLEGLTDYMTSLEKKGEDIDKVAREILADVGNMLESEMEARCESDELRGIITQKVPAGPGHYNYREIGIIYDAAYTTERQSIKARVFEFGGVYWAARPFIRPAIRAKQGAIQAMYEARLKAAGMLE